jgi:hypothetical protein
VYLIVIQDYLDTQVFAVCLGILDIQVLVGTADLVVHPDTQGILGLEFQGIRDIRDQEQVVILGIPDSLERVVTADLVHLRDTQDSVAYPDIPGSVVYRDIRDFAVLLEWQEPLDFRDTVAHRVFRVTPDTVDLADTVVFVD